ncbi:30S ribosome-binding factor RbfA [bacterium]|nr:30S ribosome-binding factor RbfA [bacterium]
MAHKRVLRVAEMVRRQLSEILDRKLEDPRIVMVTVTRVELSQDLKYAKVLVSFLGDEDEQNRSLHLVRKAVKFIRGELAYTLNLRVVPELTFELDDSAVNYIRIKKVLDQIHAEDADGESAGDNAGKNEGAQERATDE